MKPAERIIACEGFHDRAFLAGWLKHLSCTDPGIDPQSGRRRPIPDLANRTVSRGQFAFRSPGGAFIRIKPCGGKANVRTTAENDLDDLATSPVHIDQLVLCVDSDRSASAGGSMPGVPSSALLRKAQAIDPKASLGPDGIRFELDGMPCLIRHLGWLASDPPQQPGVPDQECLERLCCAAIASAYPARANAVAAWLASRPEPSAENPKSHSWSYMAGWAADHGCEDFLRSLWDDPLIVAQLETRLRSSGAWAVVESLTS